MIECLANRDLPCKFNSIFFVLLANHFFTFHFNCLLFLRVDERYDSYIGFDVFIRLFFQEKVLKLVHVLHDSERSV